MRTWAVSLFLLVSIQSAQAVEIYSAGRHFDSVEEYRKFNQPQAVVPLGATNKIEEAKPAAPELTPAEKRMQQLSYDQAVSHVVVNFEQNWKNPKPRFVTDAKQLEHVIREAMKDRHEATLLISDPKKLRIMSYDAKEHRLVERHDLTVDKTAKK